MNMYNTKGFNVISPLSRYWYLGPLKTRAAHWFSSLKVSASL